MAHPDFTTVTERAERVAIIGSGASLNGFDRRFDPAVTVIAVNGAISGLPRCDFWFTLDPSAANRARMRWRHAGVTYYAAVPDDFDGAERGVKYLRRITGDGHGRYRTKGGLADGKGGIHTGNSAWGALQLAVHMGAKRIALLGVDGHGGYFDGDGEPRELSMMPELFASAVDDLAERGVAVVNGSPASTVTCFPTMTPDEARKWLQH